MPSPPSYGETRRRLRIGHAVILGNFWERRRFPREQPIELAPDAIVGGGLDRSRGRISAVERVEDRRELLVEVSVGLRSDGIPRGLFRGRAGRGPLHRRGGFHHRGDELLLESELRFERRRLDL